MFEKDRGLRHVRREVEVGTLLIGNNKNHDIYRESITFFLVFKLQVYSVARFAT